MPLAIGYAIGRIGCQISGDGDYGEPSDVPWAMAYPDGTVPTTEPRSIPTPIYETLAMGLVACVLWRSARPLPAGDPVRALPRRAGPERFLVEFVRRNDDVLAGLTAPQLESLALLAAGLAALAVARRRGGFALAAR